MSRWMHAGTSVCPGMLPRQRNEGHRLHYPNGRYEDVQEGKNNMENCVLHQQIFSLCHSIWFALVSPYKCQ